MSATHRQFLWGLSNGIMVLAISGVLWFGLAVVSTGSPWPLTKTAGTRPLGPGYYLAWEVPIIAAAALILAGALRVRRKAMGFTASDLKRTGQTRKINRAFCWAIIGEILLAWFFIFLCYGFERLDLIWPSIALAISLHFFPLARVFRLRLYYATAAFGSAIALLAILAPAAALSPPLRLQVLGIGTGATVWITAAYAILNADQLAAEWGRAS